MSIKTVWAVKGHILAPIDRAESEEDHGSCFDLEFIGADEFDQARAMVHSFALEQTGCADDFDVDIHSLVKNGEVYVQEP